MVREQSPRGGEVTSSQPPAGVSIAEIRQLIGLMETSNISEISIERESEGLKLLLRRPEPSLDTTSEEGDEEAYLEEGLLLDGDRAHDGSVEVGAPLVGVFRTSMNGSGPLVSPGDKVRKGQIIAAIEALNLLNEVEATTAGRIAEILVLDGQAVEYGQPLLVIDAS